MKINGVISSIYLYKWGQYLFIWDITLFIYSFIYLAIYLLLIKLLIGWIHSVTWIENKIRRLSPHIHVLAKFRLPLYHRLHVHLRVCRWLLPPWRLIYNTVSVSFFIIVSASIFVSVVDCCLRVHLCRWLLPPCPSIYCHWSICR